MFVYCPLKHTCHSGWEKIFYFCLFLLFIGMIAGYILYRVKVPPKVPYVINVMLWSISLFILFIVIFGVRGGELNLIVTSLYVSLGHTGNHPHSIISSRLFLLLVCWREFVSCSVQFCIFFVFWSGVDLGLSAGWREKNS